MDCNRVFDRINPPGQPGFFFPYFFFNPTRFQSWISPPDRVGFQNYEDIPPCLVAITSSSGFKTIQLLY